MTGRLYKSIITFIESDIRAAQVLFFAVAVAFYGFAFFAANAPIDGPIPHIALNLVDAVVASIIFLLISFTDIGKKNAWKLGYLFIYVMNLVNVYLLYATEFMDLYAYQYIIAYIICCWFFKNMRHLISFVVVVNIGVIIVSLFPKTNSHSVVDFYLTYLASQVVFIVLLRYRYGIEEKLSESEKRYKLIAENSFDLICVHDYKGKLEFVSPSIKRLLGYEPEELIGTYPLEISHPDDKGIIIGIDLRDKNNPSLAKPLQYRLRHKNGEYVWIETIFTALDSPNGKTGMALSQTRDIRRSKNYQLQLEERTKDLERSNADLETFAYVSSHDMQEPLRMISNYVQLLKKRYSDKLDDTAVEYIDYAHKGSTTLQQLIRDLLSYSRISRAEIRKERVDMNALAKEVISNIKMELDDKKAEVKCSELPEVSADKTLTMLVIQNLILNGVKYNQNSLKTIEVSHELQGRETRFKISDNGIGIEPQHLTRIFEPFHRLNNKSEYPGSGLGLSTCKKIVERQGGRIWVESEIGKGSTFYFTIPN
jgi:PAS domain S-box-containing protein